MNVFLDMAVDINMSTNLQKANKKRGIRRDMVESRHNEKNYCNFPQIRNLLRPWFQYIVSSSPDDDTMY
jgi:hypothetical protein